MKRVVLVFGLIAGLAAPAGQQEERRGSEAPDRATPTCNTVEVDAAAQRITGQWREGYSEGNAGRVAALYAIDAVYLTEHFASGMVQGRTAIQAYVQRGVDAGYKVDRTEILRTDCSGEMAYVVDRYSAKNAGQKTMGVNLVALRKAQGEWRIVAYEAAVPDPATAVRTLEQAKP